MPGYPNPETERYHNIGYLRTPYPDKVGAGDWGPIQKYTGVYYNGANEPSPYNPAAYAPYDTTPCCQECIFRRRQLRPVNLC